MLSARVNLASEIAIVSPAPEEKPAPNYLKQLGEELAQHLTTCGFTSTLQGVVYRVVVSICFHYGAQCCKYHCICFYEFLYNIEKK